jgi:hypothetical protein
MIARILNINGEFIVSGSQSGNIEVAIRTKDVTGGGNGFRAPALLRITDSSRTAFRLFFWALAVLPSRKSSILFFWTSQMGQNAKYSSRGDVFRFAPEPGHRSTWPALRIDAKSDPERSYRFVAALPGPFC